MSTASHNINSQQLAYKYLKGPVLIEFLARARYNILGNDIINYLNNSMGYSTDNLIIWSDVRESPYYSDPSDIYIVISVIERITNKPLGHVTLHLVKEILSYNSHAGPIHIVNNINRAKRRRIALTQRTNNIRNGILFEQGSCTIPNCRLNDTITIISPGIMYILNQYFNSNSVMSLQNPIASHLVDSYIITIANTIDRFNSMTKQNRKNYTRRMKSRREFNNNRR